jgi:hypothetical protein
MGGSNLRSPPDSNPSCSRVESSWLLFEGACVGAVAGLWLTAGNLFDVLIDDRISGVSVPVIHRFLATEYRSEVVRASLELFALSLLVGVASGSLVALGWRLRLKWAGQSAGSLWKRLLTLAGLLGLLLGWVYLSDVAARPALYQQALFAKGGLRAWVQILVADGLGQPGVLLLGSAAALGSFLWPIRKSLAARMRRRSVVISISLLASVGLLGWFWPFRTSTSAGARGNGPPNVLVIAADSLRPDRLDAKRAPNMSKLIEQATTFERAYTPLARTFPAWVSIATGQYPHHHGIRHMFPRWETRQQRFDTLARKLSEAGYYTAVVGDFASDIFRRIDLGYQRVRTPTFTMRELVREHLLKNDPWLFAWVRGRFMRWLCPVTSSTSWVRREASRSSSRCSTRPPTSRTLLLGRTTGGLGNPATRGAFGTPRPTPWMQPR